MAIRALHNALAKNGILKSDSEHWQKLKAITARWDGDATFIRIRNEAAFHVDPALIARGIEVLVQEARDVELFKADNGKLINTSFTLGTTVLHNGIGWNMERYGQFLEHVSNDHGVVVESVQWAFIEATEAVGISVIQT